MVLKLRYNAVYLNPFCEVSYLRVTLHVVEPF